MALLRIDLREGGNYVDIVVLERRRNARATKAGGIVGNAVIAQADDGARVTNYPGAIVGRHAALDVQDRGTRGGRKAGKGIACREAVARAGLRTALHFDAGDVAFHPHAPQLGFGCRGRGDKDTLPARRAEVAVVAHDRIEHLQFTIGDSGREVDPGPEEVTDGAVFDLRGPTGDDGDAVGGGAQPFEVESAEDDHVRGVRDVDNDSAAGVGQHPRLETFRGDGDRFADRDCAEAARIEDVDLSAGSGLGDRSRESFTWRGAAAWICVVAHTRDPGPGGLRVRDGGETNCHGGSREESNNL